MPVVRAKQREKILALATSISQIFSQSWPEGMPVVIRWNAHGTAEIREF